MARYYLEFTKQGLVKYTSHLDLLRLFKRAFKRSGVPLDYSKGFNPHPRMSFAQPLSLGYTSKEEFLEFHTYEPMEPDEILRRMRSAMPMGLALIKCETLDINPKTLASIVTGARYEVVYPFGAEEFKEMVGDKLGRYLDEDVIIALKKQKKSKALVEQDIKPMIRNISLSSSANQGSLLMELNCGSASNLSPELVIQTFNEYAGLPVKRYDMEVSREYLLFEPCIPHTLGLHLDYEKSGSKPDESQEDNW